MRLDAVTGLRELLMANSAVLHSHMAIITERVSELCLDKVNNYFLKYLSPCCGATGTVVYG